MKSTNRSRLAKPPAPCPKANYPSPELAPGVRKAASDWSIAHSSCTAAIGFAEVLVSSSEPPDIAALRCLTILQAQNRELKRFRPFLDEIPVSALGVLGKLYLKARQSLNKLLRNPNTERLTNLELVLREGGGYLISLSVFKAVELQARKISPKLAGEVKTIRSRLTKRKATEEIFLAASLEIRKCLTDVEDSLLHEAALLAAFKEVDGLLDLLNARLGGAPHEHTPLSFSPEDLPPPLQPVPEDIDITVPMPKKSRKPSTQRTPVSVVAEASPLRESSVNDNKHEHGGVDRSTSTSVTHASSAPAQPTRIPTSNSGPEPEPELYEYGGHILTRSALSLVILQERMKQADSSGQYYGDVQWDPVRETWIPVYVKPLRESDVGDGDVPDRNPANFEVREEDEFGNRIGWSAYQMYYLDDPVFDVRKE